MSLRSSACLERKCSACYIHTPQMLNGKKKGIKSRSPSVQLMSLRSSACLERKCSACYIHTPQMRHGYRSARRDDVHRHCPLRAGGVCSISAVLHLHRSRFAQGGGAAGAGRGRRRVNRRRCSGRRARCGRRGSHAESRGRGGGECLKPGTWWPPPNPSSNMPRRSSTPSRRSTPSCRHSSMRSQSMSSRKPKCPKQLLLFPTEMPEPPYAEALRELTVIVQGFADDPSVLLVREHDSCPQAQQLSKALSEASSRVRGLYRDGVTLLYPPPVILPPLI